MCQRVLGVVGISVERFAATLLSEIPKFLNFIGFDENHANTTLTLMTTTALQLSHIIIKTCFCHMRRTKAQISLCIRAV